MQRSRRALLERRAFAEKTCVRNVSLSLFIVLWGSFFLFSSWIRHINGYGDIQPSNEEHLGSCVLDGSFEKNPSKEIADIHPDEGFCTNTAEHGSSVDDEFVVDEGNKNSTFVSEQPQPKANSSSDVKSESSGPKSDRLAHSVPIGLDEFKSRAFNSKSRSGIDQTGGVIHKLEPGGKEYNYASASKGAKVLASNKEAKGASNILGKDNDKYLRNPCSAEGKYVVIELSEETLVNTIELANFEHYSSNLKDFELLGSLSYPTDSWTKLGNFTAANVKQAQRFTLEEPQWVRYLRLNLLSHYGTEFYCTLSVVEVFGVDAVERMLEDLIAVPKNIYVPQEETNDKKQLLSKSESNQVHDSDLEHELGLGLGSSVENPNGKSELTKNKPLDAVEEIRQQPGCRMPADSVLKILMQKVRSLDLSLSVLERYLEEVNHKYGSIFKGFDSELGEKDFLIKNMKSNIKNLIDSQGLLVEDVDDLLQWKSLVSKQLDNLATDNFALRTMVEGVQRNQASMENKYIAVFLVCFIFGCFAFVRLLVDIVAIACKLLRGQGTDPFWQSCWKGSSWIWLLLSCSINMLILSL